MTAPIVGPYSLQYSHGSLTYMSLDPEQAQPATGGRLQTEYRHYLPPGEYMLRLTYDGPERAEVWYQPQGIGTGNQIVCSIPPGSGPRTSAPVTVVARGNSANLAIVTTPRSSTLVGSLAAASVLVIPVERYTP